MTDAADADWQALLARSVAGDADARDEIVRRFHPRVRELVHRGLQEDFRKRHRWMLALFSTRDVVQEVFADVVASLGSGEFPDEGAFIAFLTTMVRNRLLDAVRFHEAKKRDARREVRDDEVAGVAEQPDRGLLTPALAAQLAEQAAILQEVLDGFEPRKKALLTLRLVDEVTYPEIAKMLGFASAETARQAFVEAQARLLVKLRARGLRPPGETMR